MYVCSTPLAWLKCITKYGSTFYVGIGQVKVQEQLCKKTKQSATNHSQAATFRYSSVEIASRLLLSFLKVAKILHKNIHFVPLLLSFFISSFFLSFPSCITQKTIGRLQTFYIRNKSYMYAIREIPFLGQSFMQDTCTTGELETETRITVSF